MNYVLLVLFLKINICCRLKMFQFLFSVNVFSNRMSSIAGNSHNILHFCILCMWQCTLILRTIHSRDGALCEEKSLNQSISYLIKSWFYYSYMTKMDHHLFENPWFVLHQCFLKLARVYFHDYKFLKILWFYYAVLGQNITNCCLEDKFWRVHVSRLKMDSPSNLLSYIFLKLLRLYCN